MLAKGIYNTTVRKTSQLDKKGKGSVLHRFFFKGKLYTNICSQETNLPNKVSLDHLVRCARTYCLHITCMAIYTLVGFKTQSKHM